MQRRMKYREGDSVIYTRLNRTAYVVTQDYGLGYLIMCAGYLWSVPETALSPKPTQKEPISDPSNIKDL